MDIGSLRMMSQVSTVEEFAQMAGLELPPPMTRTDKLSPRFGGETSGEMK